MELVANENSEFAMACFAALRKCNIEAPCVPACPEGVEAWLGEVLIALANEQCRGCCEGEPLRIDKWTTLRHLPGQQICQAGWLIKKAMTLLPEFAKQIAEGNECCPSKTAT